MATEGGAAPRQEKVQTTAPAIVLGSDGDQTIGESPITGTVVGVSYTPEAAITGVATNNRTISVVNKGQSGSGTQTVASLSFGSGTNAAAFDEKALTLSGTVEVDEGDILAFVSTHTGTGIADPGGLVQVTIDNTAQAS